MAKKAKSSAAPPVIGELVAKFAEHREAYRRPGYNEAQLRQDFLDSFFEALGWDVNNRRGFAEAYRDVIVDHSLQVEQSVRAHYHLIYHRYPEPLAHRCGDMYTNEH